ncbi:MAG: GNAT family N-acetyltransferase [Chloroflexia bacterium]|nr:GNAT family N-acetyltransferase [Chloroflexia bacterium]
MMLTTERLILREFVPEDWPAVLAYQRHPLYQQYYEEVERTPERAREFVRMLLEQQWEAPRRKFQLAITLKSSGQLVGNCGVRLESAAAREADIGYELDPRCWGRGYATEAARAMLAFGFSELELHRVWAWCIAENARSARVLERIGMRQEGRLRDKEYLRGRWWDTLLYAILDHEWAA